MLEMLRRLLEHEDLSHCPDLKEVCQYLGLEEDEDPDLIREIAEMQIGELSTTEGGENDVATE